MPNQVPAEVAEERRDRLMRIQRRVQREAAKARLGVKTTAMLLRPASRGRWVARTEWQAPDVDGVTYVSDCGPKASPGDFLRVEIGGVRGYDLSASVCHGRTGTGQRVKPC